ncbi:nitrite/sulfite reductase [Spongiibacter sp. KMU-158]|uniref:Nitrite/sulfite reductase n=1 Tax=Spongiibacter pelagi TaxID=2760804 RepID=A0A927C0E9_9GAMM|nr:nitrite/sulfite reductase [Spongiibacter pelagi]MBD2858958.1 nitrite/sulfite reductase [Spongiibacter pelagi]
MYQYNEYDHQIIGQRVNQFRDQTQRYLDGKISDEHFLPLRLQNGLYVQRVAPMMRIAVPYGTLNARQLRQIARITRDYDKGYAHISTRQNIQLNWPELERVPDILADLAEVEMHAVQTSGNCIRNTTTDQFAGVAVDEIEDPRPWCEIIRQWSTFHPEFAFLPRKFKIAVCASAEDRAAVLVHDIGLQIIHNEQGETRFKVIVGGGLGRTPVVGSVIHEALEPQHLLSYLDAILRVYNQLGRRDNKFKARIKILVKAMGAEAFRELVDAEWQQIKDGPLLLTNEEIARAKTFFVPPAYEALGNEDLQALALEGPDFARWLRHNVQPHKKAGYAIATLPLKNAGVAPGDISAEQLEAVAALSEQFGFGEIRSTHQQNLVLPDVKQADLYKLWQALVPLQLAAPVVGTLNDMICCPGGDFCSLANAKSIPVADAIHRRFDNLDYLYDLGEIELNISGCMNACGHHHIGHIGILGVDKKGQEFFQVSLGGKQGNEAGIGNILGPSFAREEIPEVIEKILATYVEKRNPEERFIDTFHRIGMDPFKERAYA